MYIKIKPNIMDDLQDLEKKAQEIADILQINVSFKFKATEYTIEPTTKGE